MVSSLSSFVVVFVVAAGSVCLGVFSDDRVTSGLGACMGPGSFEGLSRESIKACVSLLRGLVFPSDEPDVHGLLELPVEFTGVFEEDLVGESCFRSLSTTPSPNDTVLRLFEVVPGVMRILFVGEVIVFPPTPVSVFLVAVSFPACSVAGAFRESL